MISIRWSNIFPPRIKIKNGLFLFTTGSCVDKIYLPVELHNRRHYLTVLTTRTAKQSVQSMLPPCSRVCNLTKSWSGSIGYKLSRSLFSKYSSSMSSDRKQFCFNDYDIIGFDLDCTLLRYNINEMIPLVYNLLIKFLVEKKSYPPVLLESTLDRGFMQKGLILDIERGNILKLSAEATILRASHGTTALTEEQIVQIYGINKKWSISTQFFEDPLSTWNGPLSEKLRTLLDYFDYSASLVFAQSVDVIDKQELAMNRPRPETYNVWADILDGLIEMYTRENFSNGKSEYFNTLKSHPEKYLMKTSSSTIEWIRDIRAAGKSVFLLTGSNIDFANFTASYALGNDWQDLFDSVVCFAKKPGYFISKRPYLQINAMTEVPNSEIDLEGEIKTNCVYSQGNWEQLRSSLAKKCGKSVEKVRTLYLGDNLIQDVYTPVAHRDLDAVALCEEILSESSDKTPHEFQNILSSPFWGSYFRIENNVTLWAKIISNYSKLCIPLIDDVAKKPITHKFCCENTQGYYPIVPTSLIQHSEDK